MAHRFGQFFLDPIWPCSDDENNPHNANLQFYEEEDNQICKLQEQQQNKCSKDVKLQFFQPDDEEIIQNQDCDENVQDQNSDSQSQYILQQSSIQENNLNLKLQHRLKLKKQAYIKYQNKPQQSRQQKLFNKKRPKQSTKNPLKTAKPKKIIELQRGKYNILSEQIKKQIVQESRTLTMVEVAKKYNVSVNNICRWKKRCQRRSGAGRKVTDMQMQNNLLDWLMSHHHPIPRKEVQTMAKKLSKQTDFKASKGWFERFYKRNKSLLTMIIGKDIPKTMINYASQRITRPRIQQSLNRTLRIKNDFEISSMRK